jgi:RNA recognition motif-containing protein
LFVGKRNFSILIFCVYPLVGNSGFFCLKGGESMAKTLYIGNLPWTTSEDDLSQMVAPYAKVLAVRIVKDKMTGRSRGFGFVEIEDADLEKAIAALNGLKLKERDLVVNEARPKDSSRTRG